MDVRGELCKLYADGESVHGNGLDVGGYLAAVGVGVLPMECLRDNRIVRHGYAVGIGQWHFFDDFEPAYVFGRAARMSLDCSGWGVRRAAHVTQHCLLHAQDERVLLVAESVRERADDADAISRFAQGVYPASAYWCEPGRRDG